MLKIVVLTFCLLFLSSALAECDSYCQDTDSLTLKLSVGKGVIASPVAHKDDLEFYALPSISYYSEHFYVENTKVGFYLVNESNVSLDIVGRHNRDGIYYVGDDTFGGFAVNPNLPRDYVWPSKEPHLSYMGGLEANVYQQQDIFTLGVYTDVSKVHHGEEAELSWTRLWFDTDLKLSTTAGAIYKSQQLTDYYYGGPLPGDRVNYYAKLDLAYPLTDNLWAIANYHGEWLSDTITNSPVTNEEDLHSFFIGVTWVWDW